HKIVTFMSRLAAAKGGPLKAPEIARISTETNLCPGGNLARLAAAAHCRIAFLQLLQVKRFWAQRWRRASMALMCAHISLVRRIPAKFADSTPNTRQKLRDLEKRFLQFGRHQSPSAPTAQRVATYGAS